MKIGRSLLIATSGIAWLFLLLPILILTVHGIATRGWEVSPSSEMVVSAILLSLFTTVITSVITVLFGTPLAYILARRTFRGKRFINLWIELPMVIPPAVAGLALLLTFGRRGFIGAALVNMDITIPFTSIAVIMAQTFISAPLYIRAAQIGFTNIPYEIEEAGRVDGAEGWMLFWHITLPIARRALIAGLILSWARALGEFGATILFAGNLQGSTQTMPLLVYGVFERDIDAAIWTGLILVILAMIALAISQWLTRNDEELER